MDCREDCCPNEGLTINNSIMKYSLEYIMKKSFNGFLVMHENNCPLIDALIFSRSHIFGGRQ